jgi:hypothetical protein
MKRAMTIATAGVAALVLTFNMSALAQQPDTHDRTIMTFSAPVELPGMTLQAGSYVWKIADTASRNVIQVMNKDESDILGQWLFVPAERRDVTGETVISFKETKEGTTPAVQYWYYPGEKIGKEFIYPKDQALKIAARTGATVRTEEGVVNGSGVPPESTAAAAEPPAAEATVSTPAPASEPVTTQAEAQSPAVTTESAATPATDRAVGTSGQSDRSATATDNRPESTQAANSELPRTASPLPLSGLLGFFSLAGASVLRRIRR